MKANQAVILIAVLFGLSFGYTATSQCVKCFNDKYTNKFCLGNWASPTGYCCDKSNNTDYCSNNRYFCSDNAPNDAVKLSYCPFIQQMCYGKPVTTLDDNSLHTAATTLAFTTQSVCAWKLRSTSEYYFNKQIQITILTTNNVNCHFAAGTTISKAYDYQQCQAGKTYTVDANQHVFIVAQGTSPAAYMQFSYQLVDRLDIVQVSIIYSVSIFSFVLLVGVLMVLTARFCVQAVIKQNQEYWKRMATEMSNIVRSAQRLKEPTPGGGGVSSYGNIHPPPPPPPQISHNYYNQDRSRSAMNQIGPHGHYDMPTGGALYGQRPPPPRTQQYNLY